jgi:hypothetical protein
MLRGKFAKSEGSTVFYRQAAHIRVVNVPYPSIKFHQSVQRISTSTFALSLVFTFLVAICIQVGAAQNNPENLASSPGKRAETGKKEGTIVIFEWSDGQFPGRKGCDAQPSFSSGYRSRRRNRY